MFNSDMLEAATGLVFVYLLFGFLATGAREALEGWNRRRAQLLELGILGLLSEPGGLPSAPAPGSAAGPAPVAAAPLSPSPFAPLPPPPAPDVAHAEARAVVILEKLYRSSAVFGLFPGQYAPPHPSRRRRWWRWLPGADWFRHHRLPSYIPGPSFAAGLLEVVESYANPRAGGAPGSLDRLRLAVEGVPNAAVRNTVRAAIVAGAGDPARVRAQIELWYASAMDRVSGRYRRETQALILLGSLAVALVLNINTITIFQGLAEKSILRAAVADRAALVLAGKDPDHLAADPSHAPDSAIAAGVGVVRRAGLPIGWDPDSYAAIQRLETQSVNIGGRRVALGWPIVILGWLMTGFAVSLGAPFWFDVLNKIMIVRATVKPSEKSGPEGSKDARPAGAGPTAAAPPVTVLLGAPSPAASPPPSAATEASAADDAELAAIDPGERPRIGDPQ